jgi:hypothetical protein
MIEARVTRLEYCRKKIAQSSPEGHEKSSLESLQRSIIMTLHNRISAVFSAILLVSLLGCASTPKQEGTGEYVDDTVVTTKVKAAILNEPSLKSMEINVETFKGKVQLSGFVKSEEDIRKAEEAARSVKGVSEVKNDIHLK